MSEEIDYGFVSIENDQLDTVLELLDVKKHDKQLFYEGEKVVCENCGEPIKEYNLGTVASTKDGTVFYHDNPVCFVHHIVCYLEGEGNDD